MAPTELMATSKMRTWTSQNLWWVSRILINRVKICGHRKIWNGTKATMPPNQQEDEWTGIPASFSPEAFFKTRMNSVSKAGGQAWRGGLVKSAYEFWVLPDHTRCFTNACNSRSGGSDTEASKDTSTGICILFLISLRRLKGKEIVQRIRKVALQALRTRFKFLVYMLMRAGDTSRAQNYKVFWLTRDPVPMSGRKWPEKTPDIVL